MYSWAPRCRDAWSPRSTPDCCRSPPVAAIAEADTSTPATTVVKRANRRLRKRLDLVMRRHPFRHRLGLVDLGPQRHRDEEGEVKEGQDTADLRLHRVGTRAGADLAQPHEADREQRQHGLGDPAAVAHRMHLAAV